MWEESERIRLWPNLRYYPDIYLVVTEEYHEESQSVWSVSGLIFQLGTPDYETGVNHSTTTFCRHSKSENS